MSQASIRATLATFFSTAGIPNLPQVYRAKPSIIDGRKFKFDQNSGHAACVYIHFVASSETRMTLPAVQGSKHIMYRVAVVVLYQHQIRPGVPGVDSTTDWVDALDGILDGLKARIRSDQTFGTAGRTTLFQGGEESGDIVLQSEDAETSAGVVHSWNALEFSVDEIIQS